MRLRELTETPDTDDPEVFTVIITKGHNWHRVPPQRR